MPSFTQEQRLAIAIGVPTVALLLFLWYRRRQSDDFDDDDDDENEEQTVVASAFETKLEVQIPKTLVATIIGRGGATIKQIQKESGAYLRFKDDEETNEVVGFDDAKPPEQTRTVMIRGEREKARKAELMINKIINEQPKILTEEYYIPQKSCGRIIGRGGTTIRHLSKLSGARLNIDRDDIAPDVPRKCTISGSAEQIAKAKGLLDEKIAEHELAKSRSLYSKTSRYSRDDQPLKHTSGLNASSEPNTVEFPKTSDFCEVFVSAIDTPGHFYVQLVRTGEAQKLEWLIDDITEEAASGCDQTLENIEVGTICSAPFVNDDLRYRAVVTQLNNDGTVDVYYADYGDYGTVPKYNLQKLRKEHLQLPFQAIECYLANVKPKDNTWCEKSSEDFANLTHYPQWVGLMAKNIKYRGTIPCLELYDTSTDQDININQEMVKHGYAFEDMEYSPTDVTTNRIEETNLESTSTPSASVDVEDANKNLNLSGPINPEEFSPIKSAMVKRVSKDYTGLVSMDSSKGTDVDPISEEKQINQPIVAAEVETQSSSPLDPSLTVLSMPVDRSQASPVAENVVSSPEDDEQTNGVAAVSDVAENSGFGSPNSSQVLKPEVREMIEIEVGEAFESQLLPTNGLDKGFPKDLQQTDSGIELVNDMKNSAQACNGLGECQSSMTAVTQSAGEDDDKIVREDNNDEFANDDVHHEDDDAAKLSEDVGDDINQKETEDDEDDGDDVIRKETEDDVDEVSVHHVEHGDDVIRKETEGDDDEEAVHYVEDGEGVNQKDNVSVNERDSIDDDINKFDVDDVNQTDDDDELEIFTSTLQRNVESKKTFVSSMTIESSHTKTSSITIVPSQGTLTESIVVPVNTPDTTNQSNFQAPEGNLSTGNEDVKENNTLEFQSEHSAFESPTVTTDTLVTTTTTRSEQIITNVTQSTSRIEVAIVAEQNESLNTERKDLLSSVDRQSPVDSDSESYLSALEEPASDTDTTSNYETAADHISSSTTSLDYMTPETDTDTVKGHGEENGTPVNSDDTDEFDSDDDSDSDVGDKTPKRKTSIDRDEVTPKADDSLKMAAKFLSDMDLGYKGDSEESSEPKKD